MLYHTQEQHIFMHISCLYLQFVSCLCILYLLFISCLCILYYEYYHIGLNILNGSFVFIWWFCFSCLRWATGACYVRQNHITHPETLLWTQLWICWSCKFWKCFKTSYICQTLHGKPLPSPGGFNLLDAAAPKYDYPCAIIIELS